jgi:hypothetical protein
VEQLDDMNLFKTPHNHDELGNSDLGHLETSPHKKHGYKLDITIIIV